MNGPPFAGAALAGEACFTPLLEAGVRLWAFQPSMLHAKIMTVDGTLANIGSANLNARSTALDEEINIVAIDPALARVLDEHFDHDLTRSVQVDTNRWKNRSAVQRAAEAVVAPVKRFF